MGFLRVPSRGWGKIVLLAGLGAFALVGAGEAFASAPAAQEDTGAVAIKRVAIVIDDFGNGMRGTSQMLGLPIRLTTAIMPFLPTTRQDAEAAHAKGHDVIIHLPMEPVRGKPSWLGPKAILTSLPDDEIRRRVEAAIEDVPYAVGMNNHMGSKATADERVMRIVLQVCKERGLFFLDSRTSYKTVVPKVAKEVGVTLLQNDLFLDDVYTPHHVSKQLRLLKQELEKKNSCVAIGHVGPAGLVTSGTLRSMIPKWEGQVRFVGVSELLPSR
jgi:polysaccharide deacetylase 2 family uncharacterized protein YibQ